MTQASVGFQCPECLKRQGQQVHTVAQLTQTPTPTLTIALISISVAMYIVQLVVGRGSAVSEPIFDFLLYGPGVQDGQIWQILTSGFLHSTPIHLGFNMFLLWMIGSAVEHQIGKIQYAFMYFASLFAGSAFVLAFNFATPGLGASGAVLGMFGGVAGLMVLNGRSIRDVPGIEIVALNLIIPLIIPGISFWGHMGGVVGGFLMGAVLVLVKNRANFSNAMLYGIGVGITVAWFAAAVGLASMGGLI